MAISIVSKKLRSLPAEFLQESDDVEIDVKWLSDSPNIKTEKISPTQFLSLANIQQDEAYLEGRSTVVSPVDDSLDESLQNSSFTKLLQEAEEELRADPEWVSTLNSKMMLDFDTCTKQSLSYDITELLNQYVMETDRENSKCRAQEDIDDKLSHGEMYASFQPRIW